MTFDLNRLKQLLQEYEPSEIREQFEEELQSHPDCQRFLSTFEQIPSYLEGVIQTPPTPEVHVPKGPSAVSPVRIPRPENNKARFPRWVPGLVAAVFLAAVALWFMPQPQRPPSLDEASTLTEGDLVQITEEKPSKEALADKPVKPTLDSRDAFKPSPEFNTIMEESIAESEAPASPQPEPVEERKTELDLDDLQPQEVDEMVIASEAEKAELKKTDADRQKAKKSRSAPLRESQAITMERRQTAIPLTADQWLEKWTQLLNQQSNTRPMFVDNPAIEATIGTTKISSIAELMALQILSANYENKQVFLRWRDSNGLVQSSMFIGQVELIETGQCVRFSLTIIQHKKKG